MIRLRIVILTVFALMSLENLSAQIFTYVPPIYIVNGERMDEDDVKAIHPEDIVSNELLTVDEKLIEKYGHDAANGVIVITLRYDTPAYFEENGEPTNFSQYIAERIRFPFIIS